MKAIIDKHGKLIRVLYGNAETIKLNTPLGYRAVDPPPSPNMYYSEVLGWVPLSVQPSPTHTFDYALREWVDARSIEDVKITRWEDAKRERDRAERAGFIFMGSLIDSDDKSRQSILTATSVDTPLSWTTANNEILELSAEEALGLRKALVEHIAKCHEHSKRVRSMIETATTIEDVESIDINFK